jgi:hypothetical protein
MGSGPDARTDMVSRVARSHRLFNDPKIPTTHDQVAGKGAPQIVPTGGRRYLPLRGPAQCFVPCTNREVTILQLRKTRSSLPEERHKRVVEKQG